MLPPVDEIVANFELLDDWEERYRYLIELGRMLPALPPEAHSDANLGLFRGLGLSEHLTPQRSNGVRSMVERIRSDARMEMLSRLPLAVTQMVCSRHLN